MTASGTKVLLVFHTEVVVSVPVVWETRLPEYTCSTVLVGGHTGSCLCTLISIKELLIICVH